MREGVLGCARVWEGVPGCERVWEGVPECVPECLFAVVSPPAQTVPFGVLCFLPSYKVLEKLTKRWQVHTTRAILPCYTVYMYF